LIADIVRRGGPGTEDLSHYPYLPGTTVADVIEAAGRIGGNGLVAVGTGAEVADKVEEWAETMDVDGFLLRQLVSPGTVNDFANHVMPELQRRGRYREDFAAPTLRENIFGHPRVAPTHPAAAFHRMYANITVPA
jgi:hypothetical protein